MILIAFLVIILIILYSVHYVRTQYAYFARRGIQFAPPSFPMGNLQDIRTKYHGSIIIQKIYNRFAGRGDAIAGMFLFVRPVVVVLDPELIKSILVRDFNFFPNRGMYYNERDDPLSAHLFSLEGAKWKSLRSKLSPTFSSGKMKMMFEIIQEVAGEMSAELREVVQERDAIMELKDILGRYSTDVIGRCAFGLDCNSIRNPENEFREYGKKVFEPSVVRQFLSIFTLTFPNISKKLGCLVMERDVTTFFMRVVRETLDYRRTSKLIRHDFMQLLMDLEGGGDCVAATETKLSLEEIAAQAFVFFVAGFETSSTTMSFCLYELGRHLDIQQKVRNEIESVLKKHDDRLTYEAMMEMPYLEKVVNETMRKFPAADGILRIADRDYPIPNTTHTIGKGTLALIPVYAIHHDPNIYPNPDVFNPERFNDEAVANRHPFTFLPFGEGPRVCIGMRFGLMQTRLGLISILRNFRVEHCDKTPKVVKFSPTSQLIALEGGVWLKLVELYK